MRPAARNPNDVRSDDADPHSPDVDPSTRAVLRRNHLLHGVEGGVYIGGMAFIAADSVLPAMMVGLGAPTWVVAAMPMLNAVGFCLPPLLTAHWIEGMRRVRPLVLTTGVFQRVPYLVATAALLVLWPTHPKLATGLAAVAPLLSGLAGGISYVAWQELIAKSIDLRRVSSLHALRYLVSSIIGVAAGPVIARVLRVWPDHRGYAALYGLTTLFLLVSYAIFLRIRELDIPTPGRCAHPTLRASLRSLPGLWRDDERLRGLVWLRALHSGVLVMTPFLAAHALDVTGKPRSYLGVFVSTQMLGTIGGNLLASRIGDRYGGWTVVNLSRWLLLGACVLVMTARSIVSFEATFLLYGAAMTLNMVGMNALHMEACPVAKRPTYLAVLSAVNVPALVLAAMGSALFRHVSPHSIVPAAAVALACVLFSFGHLRRLRSVLAPLGHGT